MSGQPQAEGSAKAGPVASTSRLPRDAEPPPLKRRAVNFPANDELMQCFASPARNGFALPKATTSSRPPSLLEPAFNSFAPMPGSTKSQTPHNRLRPLPAAPAVKLPTPNATHNSSPRVRNDVKGKGRAVKPSRPLVPPDSALTPSRKVRNMQPLDTFAQPSPLRPSKSIPLQPLPAFSLPPSKLSTPQRRKPLATPPRPFTLQRPESPLKPFLDTPISERATALLSSFPTKKDSVEEGTKLTERVVPPVPTPPGDWEVDEDGGQQWSPRKRGAKHKLGGLASLTANLVSSSRTDQTLWMHTLSRLIAPLQAASSPPLLYLDLAKLVQPSVRLLVLSTISFPSSSIPTSRHWEESRSVLARCRILLDPKAAASPEFTNLNSDPQSDDSEIAEEDLVGLVLFSLHLHPPSFSNIYSVPPPFLTKTIDSRKIESAALFLPMHAHDLRFVKEGAEMWVWDPTYEIDMLGEGRSHEPLIPNKLASKGGGKTKANDQTGGESAEDVFWDHRPAEQIEQERLDETKMEEEQEDVKKTLVCVRFGIVG
ncbi:hypothetical protein P7C70_g1906, partial [Phenoliferia sp. Uapishka_3]